MTHSRPRTAILMAPGTYTQIFDRARLERLRELTDLAEPLLPMEPGGRDRELADIEALITSWGAPRLTAELLGRLPKLRAVFHCAGSVRELVSDAFWQRDLVVTTAADANAVPVAEFTFAAIVLANKGALRAIRAPLGQGRPESTGSPASRQPTQVGNLGRSIGVVGFSRIGRRVVELLGRLDETEILVADPHADADEVAAAGAQLLPLTELLPRVDVLSLHAPALPATRHLIGPRELAALRDGATLINTARGSLVDHDALAAECRTGRLDAVLDVTDPEPLPIESELLRLPNVIVTPHLAGSLGTETRRLVDSALDALETWMREGVAPNRVTEADLVVSA